VKSDSVQFACLPLRPNIGFLFAHFAESTLTCFKTS
jgi:hypothetical protein